VQTDTAIKDHLAGRLSSGARTGPLIHLRDRRLILILALALLAGFLAYQAPPASDIAIGWLGDRLFLRTSEGQRAADNDSFYGDELTDHSPTGRSRWTRQDALIGLPGLGDAGNLTLTLRAQGWPADVLNRHTRQPTVTLAINGTPISSFVPTPDWADYRFSIPASAYSGDVVPLTLHATDSFTSTSAYTDSRPKGVRLAYVGVRASGTSAQFTLPAPLPLALLVFDAALCLLALLFLTRRPSLAFVLATVLVSVAAVGLALVRVWAVALLPWTTLALLLLLLYSRRAALVSLFEKLLRRYTRGNALNYGLVTMSAAWLAYILALASFTYQPPGLNAIRDNFPDSLLYGLLGMGLLLLIVVRGREGLPRLCHAVVRLIGSRRGAGVLLLLFAAIWLGYAATLIARLPYVGHADYADNAVVARNLVAGRGWVVDYVTQFYQLYDGVTRPQETWPLLQPVWIAPFFMLFGVSAWAAKLPNLLFISLLALLIYRTGARLWDRRVGLTAAIIVLTSHLFFKLMIYTTSDLAFVVFSFGAIALLYRATRATSAAQRLPVGRWLLIWRWLLGSALLTGLMLLQKPASGALIALGMGLWLLAHAWRVSRARRDRPIRTFAAGLLPISAWGLCALLIFAPYVYRNIDLFGAPFYSTESRDAWVQGYGEDWEIYRVYTPVAGVSETNGLPDHTWILRWGFDRTLLKLANQVVAIRDYLVPPWDALPLQLSAVLSGRNALLFGMGAWLALLGALGALRSKRRLFTLLLAAFVPYMLFLVVYWHADEERYFVMLLPWLALLASYALWRGYDRIAAIGDGRWTPVGLVLAIAALVAIIQPSWPIIAEKVRFEPERYAADIDAYSWLRDYALPGEVVMTRNPWQLNWNSQHPALMIPHTTNAQVLLRLARTYHARYLVFDSLQRPGSEAVRQMLNALVADSALGFEPVYTTQIYDAHDSQGRPITLTTAIYRFPENYGAVAELRP
jgi:4-amino-4-deoxy-L-arabinose transferase-like glycosyltransferase